MKRILGIRYCGGCRVGYDRTAYVNDMLAGLRGKGIKAIPEYDDAVPVTVLICGCMAQCLLRDEILPPTWHYIGPDGCFDGTPLPLEAVVSHLHNELAGMPESR